MSKTVIVDKEYVFQVTSFSKELNDKEKEEVEWAWKKEGGEIQYFENQGYIDTEGNVSKKITFDKDLAGETVYITPFLEEPDPSVSVVVNVLQPILKKEVILIAGTEQHSATYGNKMMFPAQAVREVRKTYSTEDYISILLFTDGYNNEQIKQIESASKSHNSNINFIKLTTVSQLVDYLNKGIESFDRTKPNDNNHLVQVGIVKIFAHGLPSIFDFGLDGANQNEQRFSFEHVVQLDKEMFSTNAAIYSYACRTGNADLTLSINTAFGYGEDWEEKVKPIESLAQKLADHLDIDVFAYLRRTNYKPTWDNKDDEVFYEGYEEIEDESVNGQVYRPWNWDETLWHDKGAYDLPRVGDTPRGLPTSMYHFKKNEEPRPAQ